MRQVSSTSTELSKISPAGGRAQRGLFSTDFAIGLVLFMVVLVMVLPLWDDIRFQTLSDSEQRFLQTRALSVSDILLRSPGSPGDWNESNVLSIGLANEEHVLNISKVHSLFNLLNSDYDRAKSLLGIPAYQLNISLTDATHSPLVLSGNRTEFGTDSSSARDVFIVTRIALLQLNATTRQMVNLNVIVWR